MNYIDMGEQYSAEAERLKKRMAVLKKADPGHYWQKLELNRALEVMDSMYLDCLIIGKYLKRRGVSPDEKM